MEGYKRSKFATINNVSETTPNSIYLYSHIIEALPTARKTWKILKNIPTRLCVYKVIVGVLYWKNNTTLTDPNEIGLFTFFSAGELERFERAIMDEMDEYLKTIESEPAPIETEVEPFESTLIKRR